ncbi:hypothetical protein COCC4DRAFT_197430 [Bipolaris maydis ATCC 48331]|uniref:NACHT domain-containing protein n=2 Tax=Cochliobolus heterostrophus TaxID=5016 RepID=M2UG93_COCH5|nr:uncharacterized protein COCC4DRAFT_197430 [Bipolaris maydis ATCC 48331]EMD92741.1 hypothetical protein COCHEDRAFT_1223507 [Bipolaris maydis C5]KAJ5020551.1 WD40-repeat-containing domain protein [Bipolaris maydis]ENI04869.1 hypothetical protein COCC4DRAFT_197430 [Bipolaris maydis ATCC 48331]KAJ6208398.1 WD40-repeat-containing domain protein [Bipolaris maydis]KAJ6270381.1 WD40-repeat-containing domain protein [Bipolaris maydis]
MRLLKVEENGCLSFAEFNEGTKPPYAILSHRWGAEGTEVTFEDLQGNKGEDKLGYEKIRLCGNQAQRDGLRYFWVDTCCINKANKAELSRAIQSMFRWYRDSARCYVYLSDVLSLPLDTTLTSGLQESKVQNSEWFTRGWTLQELLAPSSVEFFSQEWRKLGDRKSLIQEVHEATGIPYLALQGGALSQFSVSDRLRWIEYRHTTCPEDKAYSLAGVVDIDLAPCYGEGVEGAFRRLHDEIDKSTRCIQDLCGTDSRKDKQRIEEMKGGLLKDAYSWIFHNDSYMNWYTDPESRVLWIKGDPGKGKTMLLCGIVNELETSTPMRNTKLVSYFFCQANDPRINSATAVLRGLLYSLVNQQPSLVSCVRKKYDHIGRKVFEDANAWITLEDIFADVLQNPDLPPTTHLIIDGLDECVTDLPKLLDFIIRHSSTPRVKWIVSSRNWPEIEDRLEQAGSKVRLSLELNPTSISKAVKFFIEQRVFELAKRNNYDERTQHAVLDHLTLNANDTFLWVALACQHLQVTARRNVLRKLQSFPSGLDALYERMMQQISRKDDAELCKEVLAAVTLVYRPITLKELVTLVAPLEDLTSDAELQEIIGLCGSFLTLREQILHFVHQSAKDFLLAKATQEIFPAGQEAVHQAIFARSLQVMSTTLQKDMYGLRAIGTLIEDVKKPKPDPLAAISYSCIYWIDHLCESKPIASAPDPEHLRDGGLVDRFLRKTFLYWLESLSLCKSISHGIVSMNKLHMLAQEQGERTSLTRLVYDAYRFIMYHRQTIEISPLQTYISALLFSPTDSLIRKSYHHEAPEYISITTAMESTWDACLQTLEGHKGIVYSVAFSHDSSRIVSGSYDCTAKIWDASSGACLLTLRDHDDTVSSVAFSHNSSRVVSGSHDTTAKIWDTNSGACLLTLSGHSKYVRSVAFSYDSSWIASGSGDFTVKIWNLNNGECIQNLEHGGSVSLVAFFQGSNRLVSAYGTGTGTSIMVWDLNEGKLLKTSGDVDNDFKSVFFSHDCTRAALITSDPEERNISVLDLDTGEWLKTLRGQDSAVQSVTFSRNSTQLISGSTSGSIKIWDVTTGECLRTYEGNSFCANSMALSHDSAYLVSGADDGTVRIWDAVSTASLRAPMNHNVGVRSLDFSPDSALLASAFSNNTIKIWHVSSGKCLQTLKCHDYKGIENEEIKHKISSMAFSHDSTLLGSGSQDGIIKIWDVSNGKCLHTLVNNGHVRLVVFSQNSACLASVSSTLEGCTSKLWDLSSGKCIQNFTFYDVWRTRGHFGSAAMSHDLSLIAVPSDSQDIHILNTGNGKRFQTLESHGEDVASIAFSHDSTLLASGSFDNTVKIWDLKRGVCLQTYKTGIWILKMKFENAGPYLRIGIGTINISAALDVSSLSNNSKRCVPRFHGVSVSWDSECIKFDSKLVAQIPRAYRAKTSIWGGGHRIVSGNTIAFASRSGIVSIFKVDVDKLSALEL